MRNRETFSSQWHLSARGLPVADLTGEDGWIEDLEAEDLADVVPSTMREPSASISPCLSKLALDCTVQMNGRAAPAMIASRES